jgi:hypothetical protein
MANSFGGSPVILDTVWTAGTIPAALTAMFNQAFRLIKWVNPSTAGDECKITDINGNVLFDEFAVAAHQDVVLWDASVSGKVYQFKNGGWVLATLTAGGKLYLWK